DVARVDTGNIGAPLELDDLLIDPSRISDLQLGCEVDVSCSEQTLRHLRLESLDVSGSNEPFAVDALKRHGARLFGSSSEDLFDIVQSASSDDPHVEAFLRRPELPCHPQPRSPAHACRLT